MSCICCRVIAPFITIFLVTILIITVILAITLREADLPIVKVDSASINSLTVNTTEFTGDWNITLSFTNPNHDLRVYYNTISVELFYKDLVLTKSTLPSFIGNNTTSVINMKPSVVIEHLDSGVANNISLSREHGTVEFGLNVSTSIWFRNFFFTFPRPQVFEGCLLPSQVCLQHNRRRDFIARFNMHEVKEMHA